MTSNNTRLVYPDLVKFLAIFLVTWAHSAQAVSGLTWTNFLGGRQIDIALNMPLFMLMSGWFLDPDKLRSVRVADYIRTKFMRLMVPVMVWGVLRALVTFQLPGFFIFESYWYLTALFISLIVIMPACKLIKDNMTCALVSTVVVLACPLSQFSNVSFMFPFLWAGYGLRRAFQSQAPGSWRIRLLVVASLMVGVGLCRWWSPGMTVYRCPLRPLDITPRMAEVYVYRFAIGFCLSVPVIALARRFQHPALSRRLASLGQYSLVIYMSSMLQTDVFAWLLSRTGLTTNSPLPLDLFSLLMCIFIVANTIALARLCRRSPLASRLLVGQ